MTYENVKTDHEKKSVRILCMEDDAVLARFFQKKMERVGFMVDIAKNGEQGLEMYEAENYDIIALDYKMPVYGGLDVLRLLAKRGPIPPTIMVTGFGNEKIAVEAMKLGASDYIVKDVDGGYIELLPAVIKRILDQQQLAEEKKEAIKALKREQKLFMGGPVTVFKWKAKDNWPVEYVSSNVVQFGYEVEALMSGEVTYPNIIYPEDLEKVTQEIKEHSESGTQSFEQEYRISRSDGEVIWVYHFTVVVRNNEGEITYYDGYIMDITERKLAEEELRLAKEKAEAATLLKDKFVSLVSHDLRSPFISMLGLLTLVLNKETEYPLHQYTKNILDRVIQTGDHMVVFIEKLLNINQLRSGRIQPKFKFVEISQLTDKIISNLSHLATEKGLTIENSVPEKTYYYADPDLFAEVIQNLISNSIKFSNKGGHISVTSNKNDNNDELSLTDTGVGIDLERLPNIFDYETKTSTVGTSGEKGAGIGLPLCYEIMLSQSGTLTVNSNPSKGAVFTASLPCNHPKLLIVEEQDTVDSIRELLNTSAYEIFSCPDRVEALNLMKTNKPQLLITTVDLGNEDTLEFIRKIRRDDFFSHMKIVILSASDNVDFQERAIQIGANDFLSKPVSSNTLLTITRKYLR